LIPHVGQTLGYRLTWRGAAVAYLSDHQQPSASAFSVSAGARALCDGVDVLIHDAQYTHDEFMRKADWGHCTVDYALRVAQECGAATLVLFHHDPTHDDDLIDALCEAARTVSRGVDVVAAREGLTLRVGI
jgi:ribonuclease BN (tRNA processing enzyme)